MIEKKITICPVCAHQKDRMIRRKDIRFRQRREFLEAKRDAIESGKVVVLTLRDEFTGYFFRFNKHGQIVTLGCGHNVGA
jgi:hypothetical protein